MIMNIKNKWLRRAAIVGLVPIAAVLLLVAGAIDGLREGYRDLKHDIRTAWRG